jgi:hypothetical protein
VWTPQVTTGQMARADAMREAVEALKGEAVNYFDARLFLIYYEASDDVLPDADTPAWTKHEDESPTVAVAGGVLRITAS